MNKIDQEFSFMNRWFLFQKQEEHSSIKGFGKMAKRPPVKLEGDGLMEGDSKPVVEEPPKKKKIIRRKK